MEAYDIINLLKEKTKEDHGEHNLFICGPSYGDSNQKDPKNKLRVYAYGGLLCELPTDHTDPHGEITLLTEDHLTKNPSLLEKLQKVKEQRLGGKAKEDFLREHLEALLTSMQDWAKSGTDEDIERSQQTIISRTHTDFDKHNGTVVCDFEFAVPRKYGREGKKRPIFDLVTFSKSETGGVFTLVEYKCNENACTNLGKHSDDMLHCMTDSRASDWCKRELLRRLEDYMHTYKLLQHWPQELEHLPPENVDLQAAFLFTHGKGLRDQEKAAALCEKHIAEDKRKKFLYCFANSPESVDLSQMESWSEFKGD